MWDGGGAAEPWLTPDIHLVAIDCLREPSEIRDGDVYVLTKADSAGERARATESLVRAAKPDVPLLLADLTVGVQPTQQLQDRNVVIVEDAPSLMLGGLSAGAGAVAAKRFRCGVVDPRPFAVGSDRAGARRVPAYRRSDPVARSNPRRDRRSQRFRQRDARGGRPVGFERRPGFRAGRGASTDRARVRRADAGCGSAAAGRAASAA